MYFGFSVQPTMLQLWISFGLFFGTSLLNTVTSLRLTKFSVPPQEAHEAHLVCQFDLNGGKLYDVKWYKDEQNFLRCTNEGIQKYPMEGIIIESEDPMSSSCSFTLTGLTMKSAGVYKCEITLDAPSFPTLSKKGEMKVTSVSQFIQDPMVTTNPPSPPQAIEAAAAQLQLSSLLILVILIANYVLCY